MPARIRGKSLLGVARKGFLDRRSKRRFWLLLPPRAKVARAGARNFPRRRQRRRSRRGAKLSAAAGRGVLRRLRAATPHPPPSGAPSPQGEGFGVRPQGEGLTLRGVGDAAPYRGTFSSGGRLTGVRGVGDAAPYRGKAFFACGRDEKKTGGAGLFVFAFGCAAHCALLCSFWSMAVNSGGRGQRSSTGSPVRGWTKRRPVAWRHWPVRPGTGFLAP